MGKRVKVLILGAGSRGMAYSRDAKALPECYEVVGVAEPIDCRRNYIGDMHGLPEERRWRDWREALAEGRMADAVFICTMDRDHLAPAMRAIELGYDVMLEKPIAPTPEECAAITKAAEAKGVKVLICHVLRFTPFFGRIKQMILDGYLGDVQVIEQIEQVGMGHQAHSFVRGNWGNSTRSSTMLLQKSCHDIDIIQWLMDKRCERVSSFGSLRHFRRENAPEGAPERCLDGCPHADTCPFNADKFYYHVPKDAWYGEWLCRAATQRIDPTEEETLWCLNNTNYGRCVYYCDNDVVDRQVVNMEFEGGAVASFTMTAFTPGFGGRFVRVMGTRGMLSGRIGQDELEYDNFITGEKTSVSVLGGTGNATLVGGHGGGDRGIMNVFCQLVTGEYEGVAAAPIDVSCQNHMIVFAAEEARKKGTVVDVREYAARYGM